MNYIESAHKTLSPHFYGEKVLLIQFAESLKLAISALKELDAIKKALFYGKNNSLIEPVIADMQACETLVKDTFAGTENLIHGILGKATEAGELLEALEQCYVKNKSIDHVNVLEEIGDGLWYDAILLQYINSDFSTAQQINIAKLAKRFPDKFTEKAAIVRDLDAERKILEQKEYVSKTINDFANEGLIIDEIREDEISIYKFCDDQ